MSDITTTTRFKLFAGITGTAQDTLIARLITQATAQIERYLRRTLVATSYKTWLDGSGSPILRLYEYPILSVYKLSTSVRSVASISNTSATVSHASVSFDGTNLVLTEVSTAGTETISELPVATSKVISTLKTAIEAKAGWSCSILSTDYESLPTAHLRPIYGQNAMDPTSADLVVPGGPSAVKILNEDSVELINSELFPSWDIFPGADRLPNRMSAIQPGITPPTFSYGFPAGTRNIFVWYKAGYTMPTDMVDGTLPAGLELIAQQVIGDVLGSTKINSNLSSESIGDYSYSLRTGEGGSAMASAIENRRKDLNQYRRISI